MRHADAAPYVLLHCAALPPCINLKLSRRKVAHIFLIQTCHQLVAAAGLDLGDRTLSALINSRIGKVCCYDS